MHGLDLYDFHARQQDPALNGRFTSVDPMAEKKPWMTPYHYCSNNPINRIDPNGMDDYFSKDGTYLGTDNSESYQVRVIDEETWNNNHKDGVIDPAFGVNNSALHSASGIKKNASMAIFKHYFPIESMRLESKTGGNTIMQYSVEGRTDGAILFEQINVYIDNAKKDGVADNIYDIKNTFVHEIKHYQDRKLVGIKAFFETDIEIIEMRAILTQVADPTWEKTSSRYKTIVKNYAEKNKVVLNESGFQVISPSSNVNNIRIKKR